MNQLPVSQDEWTVHSLNIHGVFFERKCASVVATVPNWRVVSTNYPVEIQGRVTGGKGGESSLDVWARRDDSDGFVLDALLECKKANPDFVNWVFFPKISGTPNPGYRHTRTITKSEAEAQSNLNWTHQVVVQTGTTSEFISNDSREVRGDYVRHLRGDKTKTSNASIQEAAYQIAIAQRAIVQRDSVLLAAAQKSSGTLTPPWRAKAYSPIIVTTANLYRVNFDIQDVNIETGEINNRSATLSPVNSLIYEYPLPNILQHTPVDSMIGLDDTNLDLFSRMDIIVVRSVHLKKLLGELV